MKLSQNKQRLYLAGAIGMVMAAPIFAQPVQAQQAPAEAADPVTGSDIIVTARRSQERIQDVPVAVTAFTGEGLRERNITDLRAVNSLVPGLTIAEANSPSTLIITIRGLANVNPLTGADATAGLYINEVPINFQAGTNVSFFDIENIQVLKAPQGTLFGRNSTAGAVLLQTARPTGRLEGSMSMGGTFFRVGGGFQGEAVLNVPVAEGLDLRVAGRIVDRDGYVRNIAPRNLPDSAYGPTPFQKGRTDFSNLLRDQTRAGRVSALLKPTDNVESLFVYEYAHFRGDGLPAFSPALNPNGAIVQVAPLLGFEDPTAAYAALVAARKDYKWVTMTLANVPVTVETHTLSNTTTIDLSDNLKLKNIAGYRHVNENVIQDIVGLPGPYFIYEGDSKGYNFSDEIQLQGNTSDDRLKWSAGLFYFRENRELFSTNVAFGGVTGILKFGVKTKSFGAYAQGTYKLTDKLSLTLGGRYNWDQRSARVVRYAAAPDGSIDTCLLTGGTPTNCLLADTKSFDAFTYTAALDYKLDADTLLYATTRRGYRGGGYSDTQVTQDTGFVAFRPEKLTDYELGLKRDWRLGGDASLRTNIAVFYDDYTDVQRLVVDQLDFSNQLIVNAPKTTVKGLELEVTLRPVSWLALGYSYAYVDPKYKSFVYNGVDYSTKTFAYTSRHVHHASLTVDLPLGPDKGTFNFQADYNHQSPQFYDELVQETQGGVYPAHTLTFGPYSTVNLKGIWRGVMGSTFDVELFVNNLTNSIALPNGTPNAYPTLGMALGFYSVPPRMAGFNLRYNF